MKYLPSRDLETVSSALDFSTSDCRIAGGCDLYTTKAAGGDKKLYKNIEQSLESQHSSLIRLAESMSPPHAEMFNLNLERSSPFGPLSQRSLKAVMHTVDETLYNLRPRPLSSWSSTYSASSKDAIPQTPGGGTSWSPRMWKIIDKEMTLRECEVYRYSPEEDPFDGEESAIWSHNYFFFNKERRRVLYIHFRGLSPASYSPTQTAFSTAMKRPRPISRSLSFSNTGAGKRARYWLGDKADRCVSEPVWGEDMEEEDSVIANPGDDEVDADDAYDEDEQAGFTSADEDDDEIEMRFRDRGSVRAISQEIVEAMEV